MKRGILFTIDAALALLATAAFLAVITNMAAPDTSTGVIRFHQFAGDMLFILERNATFSEILNKSDGQAITMLENDINAMRPIDLFSRISIDVYAYNTTTCGSCNLDGSVPINGFCHCRSFNTSGTVGSTVGSASSLSFAFNNSVPTFVNVTAWVWQN